MKYGILNHNNDAEKYFSSKEEEVVNIGDYVQSYGVKVAYLNAGIDEKDIVLIEKKEISRYKGEKVTLVMNNVFGGNGIGGELNLLPTSADIIPFFVGFNCHDEYIIQNNYEYLKKWEPIGCRDEKTKNIMEGIGIKGFVTGCSSLLINERKQDESQKTIFCIDLPQDIEKYIPPKYRKDIVFASHHVYAKNYLRRDDMTFYNLGQDFMTRYAEEAKLVITSKLHCVVPCLAMGIPVILVLENIDYRFSWLEKLIPIYSDWNEIDWEVKTYDVEIAKEKLLNVYKEYIKSNGNIKSKMYEMCVKNIDNFYMDRERSTYNANIIKKVSTYIKPFNGKNIEILIWGAGRTGMLFYDIVNENFSNIKVNSFIDSFKTGNCRETKIISPNEISKQQYDYIFLCSLPGKRDAINKMRELKLVENKEYAELYFENSILGG